MVQIWSGGGNFAVFQLHFVYSDNFPTLDLFSYYSPRCNTLEKESSSAEVSRNDSRIPDFNGNLGATIVAVLNFSG